MASIATPQVLNYSQIVDVNLSATNDVNFADVEDYGHRVMIDVNLAAMNNYLKWDRAQDGAYPLAGLDSTKEAAFKTAIDAALSQGFVDIDGITGGLHFGSANFDTNTDVRKRINGGISANDIALCFVLYKLYGASAVTTLNKIYNLEDSYGMLSNSTVSTAIVNSFKTNVGGSLKNMLRDLISADPHRFFDASGVPMPGIFEINPDSSSSGTWNITENDIIEVKLKLIFQSKVTRRGVAGREHDLTTNDTSPTLENQETIINPNDYFYVRLQMRAKTAAAAVAASSSGGSGGSVAPTPWGGVAAIRTTTSGTNGVATITDSNNNIYLIANISNSVEISNFTAQSNGQITPSVYATLNGGGVCLIKYSSTGQVMWATSIQRSDLSAGTTITTDNSGNVYVSVRSTSYYNNPLIVNSFGPPSGGSIVLNAYATIQSTGTNNCSYLVKYNSSGQAQWVTRITSPSNPNAFEIFYGLAANSSGDVYAVGFFGNTDVSIHNANQSNPSSPTLYGKLSNSSGGTSNPGQDVLLVKYDTNGQVIWATKVGTVVSGTGVLEIGSAINLDSTGNVYITARLSGSSPTIFNYETTNNQIIQVSEYAILNISHGISNISEGTAAIIKYNSSGKAQWANIIGGFSSLKPKSFYVDSSSNVYVLGLSDTNVGFFNAVSNATPGNTQISPTYYGNFSITADTTRHDFLVKYNSAGAVQWATLVKTGGYADYGGLVTDSSQNVYISSEFNSNPMTIYSFTSKGGTSINLSTYATLALDTGIYGSADIYIIKYNSSGDAQWATKIGGGHYESGYGLAIDSQNAIYITGSYQTNPAIFYKFNSISQAGEVTLDTYGTISSSSGAPSNHPQGFIARYNTNGKID